MLISVLTGENRHFPGKTSQSSPTKTPKIAIGPPNGPRSAQAPRQLHDLPAQSGLLSRAMAFVQTKMVQMVQFVSFVQDG